jgi:hypothetical protein
VTKRESLDHAGREERIPSNIVEEAIKVNHRRIDTLVRPGEAAVGAVYLHELGCINGGAKLAQEPTTKVHVAFVPRLVDEIKISYDEPRRAYWRLDHG